MTSTIVSAASRAIAEKKMGSKTNELGSGIDKRASIAVTQFETVPTGLVKNGSTIYLPMIITRAKERNTNPSLTLLRRNS